MLRVASSLALGIALGSYLGPVATYVTLVLGVLGCALLLVPLPIDRRGTVRGAAILLLFVALGFGSVAFRQNDVAAPDLSATQFFTAQLLETPRGSGAWLGADAEILTLYADTGLQHLSSRPRVKLMFAKDSQSASPPSPADDASAAQPDPGSLSGLGRGSRIVSAAALDVPDPPRNPHTFDYRTFLASRNIHLQAWLRAEDFRVTSSASAPTLLETIRAYVATRIDRHYRHPREAGVARALLLGDKSGLDEATRLTYSSTGAVHVLAVSGLHTGVIAAVIVWLLARVMGKRRPWFQFGVLVMSLLFYAALTGMSPSVLRACFMFIIIFAGRILREDAQPLNNLGTAATLTLLVTPAALFGLGFQLSYLAVAGILLLAKPITKLLATGNRFLDLGGSAIAVAFAATLGTLPVTIFSFHQFPVYFALSTPVVFGVAAALWSLLGELLVDGILVALGVEFAYTFSVSNAIIFACNEFLDALTRLPGVLVEGLWPSSLTVILLLLTVACGAVLANRKRRGIAFATAVLLGLSGLSASVDAWRKVSQSEYVVYALRQGTLVDVFRGGHLQTQPHTTVEAREFVREIAPHRAALGHNSARRENSPPAAGDTASAEFYALGGLRWAYLSSADPLLDTDAPEVDWVIVAQPQRIDADDVARAFPTADVLLAGRPAPWLRPAWDSLGMRVHVLADDGAYRREF